MELLVQLPTCAKEVQMIQGFVVVVVVQLFYSSDDLKMCCVHLTFFLRNTLLCIDLRFFQDPTWQKTLVSKQLAYFWFWLYLRDCSRTGSFGLHPAKHFNEWDYSFNAGCPLLTTMMPNLMKHGLWYHDANSALLYITQSRGRDWVIVLWQLFTTLPLLFRTSEDPLVLKKILFLFHMLRQLEEEGKSLQIAIFDQVQYIARGLKLSF